MRLLFLFTVLIWGFAACAAEDDRTVDSNQGSDTATGDEPEGSSDEGSAGEDKVCDEKDFDIARGPVKLMFLQDFSLSMTMPTPNPKWNQAIPAIGFVLSNPDNAHVWFGFDIFPDNSDNGQFVRGCGVKSKPPFDTVADQADDISNYLNDPNTRPLGNKTPLYCALGNFLDNSYAPAFLAQDYDRYLIVVSDGADNCNTNCNVNGGATSAAKMAERASNLAKSGVLSVVVGFGEEVANSEVAEEQLTAIAENGGTQFNQFLKASDQVELEEALGTIAGSIISCTFRIEEVSDAADPNKVNFYFDDELIGYDPACDQSKGWTWNDIQHTEIRLCDEACGVLQDGKAAVRATFGCPSEPVV